MCSAPVRINKRSVQCNACAFWLHAGCIGLSNEDYSELQCSDDPWCCSKLQKESLPFINVSNSDSIFNTSDSFSPVGSQGDAEPTSSTHSHPPRSLTVLYTNCRSLLPKINHVRLHVTVHHPHIISICETWLDESISSHESFIPGFSLVHRDRDRHGGGVAIFIHNSVQSTIHLKHPTIELLLLDLKLKSSKITCGLYYRPPSSTQSDLASLEATLDELPPSCAKSLLLLGDFNIDTLRGGHQQLSSIEDKFGLKQVVSPPTRTTQSTSTLINQVYLSDKISHSSCSIQPPVQGSEYNSILLSLRKPLPPPRKQIHCRILLYKDSDFDSANTTLQCFSSSSSPQYRH